MTDLDKRDSRPVNHATSHDVHLTPHNYDMTHIDRTNRQEWKWITEHMSNEIDKAKQMLNIKTEFRDYLSSSVYWQLGAKMPGVLLVQIVSRSL